MWKCIFCTLECKLTSNPESCRKKRGQPTNVKQTSGDYFLHEKNPCCNIMRVSLSVIENVRQNNVAWRGRKIVFVKFHVFERSDIFQMLHSTYITLMQNKKKSDNQKEETKGLRWWEHCHHEMIFYVNSLKLILCKRSTYWIGI